MAGGKEVSNCGSSCVSIHQPQQMEPNEPQLDPATAPGRLQMMPSVPRLTLSHLWRRTAPAQLQWVHQLPQNLNVTAMVSILASLVGKIRPKCDLDPGCEPSSLSLLCWFTQVRARGELGPEPTDGPVGMEGVKSTGRLLHWGTVMEGGLHVKEFGDGGRAL